MGPGQEGLAGRRSRGGLTLDIPAITGSASSAQDAAGAHESTVANKPPCKKDTSNTPGLSPLSATNMVAGLGEKLVVVETIGRGNSGTVSLAVDACEGTVVAVKTISLLDDDHKLMLKHEVDALRSQRLQLTQRPHGSSGSPYIVDFYGAYFSDDENAACIVVEYMPFGNLQQWVDSKKSMPEEWLSQIAYEGLGALVHLHEQKHVHRDVKPSNILISRTGNIKLSDFGITREIKDKGCTSFVGTFNYMSPERLTGEAYSYNSDVWSLGMCLATCILGQCPFPPDQTFWQLLQKLEVPLQMLSSKSMSSEMRDFVSQCLVRDPKTRPQAVDLLRHPFLAHRTKWEPSKWTVISASSPSAKDSPGSIRSLVRKVEMRRERLGQRSLLEDAAATTTLAEHLGIEVGRIWDTANSEPEPASSTSTRQTKGEGNLRRLSFAHMKAPWAPQNALSGCPPKDGAVGGLVRSHTADSATSSLPLLSVSSTTPLWRSYGGSGAADGGLILSSEEATFGNRRKIVPGTRSDSPWSSLPQQDSPSSGEHQRRALRHSFGDARLDARMRLAKARSGSQAPPSSVNTGRRNRALTDSGPPASADGSAMLASCSMLRAITGHSAKASMSHDLPALLASRATPTAASALRRLAQSNAARTGDGHGDEADAATSLESRPTRAERKTL
jgi:serine/threonine protein kinase